MLNNLDSDNKINDTSCGFVSSPLEIIPFADQGMIMKYIT